jgi:glycosyltransferase involved in cell wall biosynthesis
MSPKIKPLTFLVTALNEEEHIEGTAKTITGAVSNFDCDYEILLVDDGSTDKTPEIMDRMAGENPRVKVLHNEHNLGLGGAYKRGVQYASREYVMWVSGDNAEIVGNMRNIIAHVGEADIVVPVLKATKARPWLRRFTSRAFTLIVNFLFGLKVNYYNGTVIHRTDLIRTVDIKTNSFAYQAEALVKLLRQGHSYVEIPYTSATYDGIFSYAMRPKNLIAVFKALGVLFIDVRLGGAAKPVKSTTTA